METGESLSNLRASLLNITRSDHQVTVKESSLYKPKPISAGSLPLTVSNTTPADVVSNLKESIKPYIEARDGPH